MSLDLVTTTVQSLENSDGDSLLNLKNKSKNKHVSKTIREKFGKFFGVKQSTQGSTTISTSSKNSKPDTIFTVPSLELHSKRDLKMKDNNCSKTRNEEQISKQQTCSSIQIRSTKKIDDNKQQLMLLKLFDEDSIQHENTTVTSNLTVFKFENFYPKTKIQPIVLQNEEPPSPPSSIDQEIIEYPRTNFYEKVLKPESINYRNDLRLNNQTVANLKAIFNLLPEKIIDLDEIIQNEKVDQKVIEDISYLILNQLQKFLQNHETEIELLNFENKQSSIRNKDLNKKLTYLQTHLNKNTESCSNKNVHNRPQTFDHIKNQNKKLLLFKQESLILIQKLLSHFYEFMPNKLEAHNIEEELTFFSNYDFYSTNNETKYRSVNSNEVREFFEYILESMILPTLDVFIAHYKSDRFLKLQLKKWRQQKP